MNSYNVVLNDRLPIRVQAGEDIVPEECKQNCRKTNDNQQCSFITLPTAYYTGVKVGRKNQPRYQTGGFLQYDPHAISAQSAPNMIKAVRKGKPITTE